MTERKFLDKIDSGINLTASEIKELILNFIIENVVMDNPNNRCTIVSLCGRCFMINWSIPVSDDSFCNQPVEVERKEFEKIVIDYKWVPKNAER